MQLEDLKPRSFPTEDHIVEACQEWADAGGIVATGITCDASGLFTPYYIYNLALFNGDFYNSATAACGCPLTIVAVHDTPPAQQWDMLQLINSYGMSPINKLYGQHVTSFTTGFDHPNSQAYREAATRKRLYDLGVRVHRRLFPI